MSPPALKTLPSLGHRGSTEPCLSPCTWTTQTTAAFLQDGRNTMTMRAFLTCKSLSAVRANSSRDDSNDSWCGLATPRDSGAAKVTHAFSLGIIVRMTSIHPVSRMCIHWALGPQMERFWPILLCDMPAQRVLHLPNKRGTSGASLKAARALHRSFMRAQCPRASL